MQTRHKAKPDPLYDQAHPKKPVKCNRPAGYSHDAVAQAFICLAGKHRRLISCHGRPKPDPVHRAVA